MADAMSDPTDGTWPRIKNERLYWVVAAVAIGLLMLGRLWWLPVQASLNVNEGWNTGQAIRAFGPGSLYPDPEALIANNYPPLSFLIVGALGQAIGDHIIAGRIVALVSQLATGAAIWAIVRRLAPGQRWTIVAALLFGAFSVTLLRKYIAINDPQWLGHAAMSWAVFCLVPQRAGARLALHHIVLAALLMIAGGLIKHNLVAFPIAATIWLWLYDRRTFATWIATGAVLGAIACAGLFAIWGTTVFTDVLSPARSYSLARMLAKGMPLAGAMAPALIACWPLWAAQRADRRLALPLLVLAVSIPIGVLQRAGSGVDINACFESIIAMAIAVPVAVAQRDRLSYAWIGISALPALCLLPLAIAQNGRELTGRDAAVRHWAPFIARVATAKGPVACDDQAICYWAGRMSDMDFFSIKQRLLQGKAAALAPALAEGRFVMIEMRGHNPGWQENRLIPAIRAHYRTIYAADGMELLVPSSDTALPTR